MLTVSVIIVNWNTREFINDCIFSIPKGAGDITYEVIVVDNASSDGSADYIEKNLHGVKLIRNSVNTGFACACNKGASSAKGRYLFFLNPDTMLEKDSMKILTEFAEGQKWLGAAGPQLAGRGGKIQNSARRFPRLGDILIRDTIIGKIAAFGGKNRLVNRLPKERPSSVEQISGAAFFIRRDLWRDIGGMDERFFMFYEEVDLCRRLKDLGYSVYYLPSARIIHKGGGSRKKDNSRVFCYSVKSMFLYLKKYEPAKRLFLFKMIFKPLFLMRLVTEINNKAKREYLKRCLKEFISL